MNKMQWGLHQQIAELQLALDTLLTWQDPAVSNSEGPEYSVQSIIFLTSQNGYVTCTGCSERELLGSSSLESGKESAPILM